MRQIFIDDMEFKRIINPPKGNRSLQELTHPERLLSPNLKIHKYPEGYTLQQFDTVTPINCNILITNKEHDGIWLLDDSKNNRVIIPHKVLDEEELVDIQHNEPISAIYKTIIKALIGFNKTLNPGFYDYEGLLPLRLYYILKTYGLDVVNQDFPIYYNFYMGEFKDELNLFLLVEVEEPKDNVPPLLNYEYYNLIWYTRKDLKYSLTTSRDKRQLFCSRYEDDIRTTEEGITLLEKIFKTENIFGLLDIY